jgi:hypothetical protein
MNFNHTENLMDSPDKSKKPLTSKSGADLSKDDSYGEEGEEDDEYGAEDIIKELLKEGYFNDLAKK